MIFELGDWAWLHLCKERSPTQWHNKLLPRRDGPFQVVERINDNAYKLDLPCEYSISATFNVSDLSPFFADDVEDLRANSFQEEGNDGDQGEPPAMQVEKVPLGLVTRARAKQFHPCF